MKASNSGIQYYKACRRLYQLKYVYGIEVDVPAEALERGISYHSKIEQILNTNSFEKDDNVKTNAMAEAFMKYIVPKLNPIETEKWFEYQTESGHTVVGRIDGLNADGRIIEHKTTSASIDGNYIASLENDEQILTYMTAFNTNHILYTICRTPTIRLCRNETEEEFEKRCIEWYDVDTESKIAVIDIYRSPEQIEDFKRIQDLTISEIESCKLWYKSPHNCMKWGRMCEYAAICNHPEVHNGDEAMQYINFNERSNQDES